MIKKMAKSRKAQVGEAIKYGLIGLFSIIILVSGYKMVSIVKEKACQTEISKFEIDLRGIDKSLRFGAKELQSYIAPCQVDKIYFFDLSKKINPSDFSDIPLLRDSLESGGGSNVFLVREGEVKRSFYAGNLEILYPYDICFVPNFGRISFFAEGAGKSVKIRSACNQPECTLIPVSISEDDSKKIIQEAIYFGCTNCPTDLDSEANNIQLTRQNVEIFRRFLYCDGITDVQIIIKPKKGSQVKDFRYYEFIPKDCIEDLNKYLAENIGSDVDVKADPLILWHFADLGDEKRISYKLSTDLSDDCKQAIKGLGVAHSVENQVNKKNLKFKPIPDQEFKEGEDKFNLNLWTYTDYDGMKKDLSYTILSQNTDVAECSIKNEGESSGKLLECERKSDNNGSSDVKLQVTDGVSSDTGEVKIIAQAKTEDQAVNDFKKELNETDIVENEIGDNNIQDVDKGLANLLILNVTEQQQCNNTDTNCGEPGNCIKCSDLNYQTANYCLNNNIFKDLTNYACQDNKCVPSTSTELVQACSQNQACQSGNCILSACSDGTQINQCSLTKPQYCNSNANLVNNCAACGCPTGKVCQSDGSCINAVGQLSASYLDLAYGGTPPQGITSSSWVYYTTALSETGGQSGITIQSSQRCLATPSGRTCQNYDINGLKSRFGTNFIAASGTISSNDYITFNQPTNVTETFNGIDINNNPVSSSYTFSTTGQAQLSASSQLQSTQQQDIYKYFYYDINIQASGGVGVTINSRQKCFKIAGCNDVKTNIIEYLGTNYILPNGQINSLNSINQHYWYTSYSDEVVTETFWGVDDNDNNIQFSYSMNYQ